MKLGAAGAVDPQPQRSLPFEDDLGAGVGRVTDTTFEAAVPTTLTESTR
jgi:hypothetical protein